MRVCCSWNWILTQNCDSISVNIVENNFSNDPSSIFISTDSVFDAVPHSVQQFTWKNLNCSRFFALSRAVVAPLERSSVLSLELSGSWSCAQALLIGSRSGCSSLRSNRPDAPHPTLPHRERSAIQSQRRNLNFAGKKNDQSAIQEFRIERNEQKWREIDEICDCCWIRWRKRFIEIKYKINL